MSAANVTSAPAPPPSILRLDPRTIIGPLFIGNMINWLLMGTLIVQVYVYYINTVTDRLIIQLLVYSVFILDVAQTTLGTHFAWYYAIENWNNFPVLTASTTWSEATIPIMCGLVAALVQFFYAWRIWHLKETWIMRGMAILITIVALGQSTSAIVASAIFEPSRTQPTLLRLHPAFEFWLAGSFVADILISGCMIWILYSAKTRTSFSHSESAINRLITNTIQTGTATVVCAGIDLALFVKLTDTNYHITPAYILGKLYSNSLLVTLNARKTSSSATMTNQSESYAMRSRGSRQTQRTFNHERTIEDWPGVKLSQIAASETTITQHDPSMNIDLHGRPVQVIGLANGKSNASFV